MKSKMTALFATLMIALMVAGFAYAHWSETLYINGVVKTGKLDVEFSGASTNDPDGTNDPGLKNVITAVYEGGGYRDEYAASGDYGFYTKDVANTTVAISNTHGEQNDTLTINFNNVYPSYAPEIIFLIDNHGDIPVFMTAFTISYASLTGDAAAKKLDLDGMELIAWEVTLNGEHVHGSSKGTYTGLPFTVDNKNEGIYCFANLIGYLMTQQIDGGDYLDVHLIFHFEQWLVEGSTMKFDMTATFTQWNLVK
jgi:hypothetical protein